MKLIINSNTISFGDKIFKTANVNSVEMGRVAPKGKKWLGLGLLIALVGLTVTLVHGPGVSHGEYFFRLFFSIGMIVLFLYLMIMAKGKYFLFVRTSSGSMPLFSHKDYKYVVSIKDKILASLNKHKTHVIQVDNRTLINAQNLVVQNLNHYSGLSDADKDFLRREFAPVLAHIEEKFKRLDNDNLSVELEKIKTELKKEKPSRSILERAWRTISNLHSLGEIAEVMEKAINLF